MAQGRGRNILPLAFLTSQTINAPPSTHALSLEPRDHFASDYLHEPNVAQSAPREVTQNEQTKVCRRGPYGALGFQGLEGSNRFRNKTPLKGPVSMA